MSCHAFLYQVKPLAMGTRVMLSGMIIMFFSGFEALTKCCNLKGGLIEGFKLKTVLS